MGELPIETTGITFSNHLFDGETNFSMTFLTRALEIGQFYGGGYVFYLDNKGGGLVASSKHLTEGSQSGVTGPSFGYEWGCNGLSVSGADNTSIGTGLENTNAIIDQGCLTVNGGITAAKATQKHKVTHEGEVYEDWYLPSKDELQEIYNKLRFLNLDGFEIYDDYEYYWSSSSSSPDCDSDEDKDKDLKSWGVYFNSSDYLLGDLKINSGDSRCERKTCSQLVRAVRLFP